MNFSGKRVFVTGGSSGIGKETALLLARKGASVYIAARGKRRLEEALAGIRAAATTASQTFGAVALDVSDRKAVEQAVAESIDALGGLDIVLANAGVAAPGFVLDLTDDDFEATMKINFFGAVHVTRAAIPHFIERRSGHVVMVSSVAGLMGIYGYSAYSPSKFAMIGYAESLRHDLLRYGIPVTVVCPADVDTPQLAEENEAKPPETKALAGNVKPVSAEFVARAILDGIAGGRFLVVPGAAAKFTVFVKRHFPRLTDRVTDAILKRYDRRSSGA